MTLIRRLAMLVVLLTLSASVPAARSGPPQGKALPFNIGAEREALYNQYAAEVRAIRARIDAGQVSPAQGFAEISAANRARFNQARASGASADRVLNSIINEAQQLRAAESARTPLAQTATDWRGVKNTGTPLGDPTSRGIFGDQDLTFRSDADRAAFVQAAKNQGYTVEGRLGQGYVTVRELDVVAHGPSTIPADPLSAEARLQTHYRADGHESFAARGSRYPYLAEGTAYSKADALGAVADNIKKVEKDLALDPRRLAGFESEVWAQNLAKGTGRAMDAAGRSIDSLQKQVANATNPAEIARLQADLTFREQLASLKSGMDPRATGLVPPNASDAEAARILKGFQDTCLKQYGDAYKLAVESNRQLIAEMDGRIATLLKEGQTGAAARLTAERASIIDGAAQAVQHLATGEGKGQLLAEIAAGGRLTPSIRDGVAGFTDAKGNFMTEAEAQAAGRKVISDAQAQLGKGPNGEPIAAGRWSNAERGMIYAMAVLGGIQGGLEEREAATREGRDPSNTLAALRGIWAATGIQQAFSTGYGISKENMDADFKRIEQMIREGKDPHEIQMALLTLTKTLAEVAGHFTGVSSMWEGGKEFYKLLGAAATDLKGPPGDINALVLARRDALIAAIETEVTSLNALLTALDATATEAASKLNAFEEASTRLSRILARIDGDRESIDRIKNLKQKNEGRRTDIDTLKQQCSDALQRATDAARDLQRDGKAVCDYSTSASNTADTPPASVASAWQRAQDAKKKVDDAYNDLADRYSGLSSVAKSFDDDDALIEVLCGSTKPREAIQPAATALEALRSASENAAEPVAAILSLVQGIQNRANGIKIRTDMLINAGALVERASGLAANALDIADRTKAHDARMTAFAATIRATASGGYDAVDQAIDDAKVLEGAAAEACGTRPQAVDHAATDEAYQNSGVGLQAAASSFDSAKSCAENVPGLTPSDFTSTTPSTVTTTPARPPVTTPKPPAPPPPPPRPAPKYTFWSNEGRCGQIEIGTVEDLKTPRQRGGGECCGCALDAKGAAEPMVRKQLGGEFATDKEAVAALCAMIGKLVPGAPTDPWYSQYAEIGGKRYPWGGGCPAK